MGTQGRRGFTVIETVLFLAITGLLILAFVGGSAASINIQRYRDSVESFKNLLQSQYSALNSVENDRTNDWSCNGQALTTAGVGDNTGQSECYVLGKLVVVEGSNISTFTVLGARNSSNVGTDDITKLNNQYNLNISNVGNDKTTLEWGTEIAWPTSSTTTFPTTKPVRIALLFIRSPDSGRFYTFSSYTVTSTPSSAMLKSMIVGAQTTPGRGPVTLCLQYATGAANLLNNDQSIYIAPYASSPSAIESQSNSVITDTTVPRADRTMKCA